MPATWCATPNARCWWCDTDNHGARSPPPDPVRAVPRCYRNLAISGLRVPSTAPSIWQRASPMSLSARSSSSAQCPDGGAAFLIVEQRIGGPFDPADKSARRGLPARLGRGRRKRSHFRLQQCPARPDGAVGASAIGSACALLTSDCLRSPQCNRGIDMIKVIGYLSRFK
jgi:hypothetical protein